MMVTLVSDNGLLLGHDQGGQCRDDWSVDAPLSLNTDTTQF